MDRKLKLGEVPADRLATSPDGQWVVGWWISYSREDRYEDVTEYTAGVFSVETGKAVQYIFRRYVSDNEFGESKGSSIYQTRFSEDGQEILLNRGVIENDRVPFEPDESPIGEGR